MPNATRQARLEAGAERTLYAVACLFPGYGLADLWARDGMPCVPGHALSRPARQGGNAKHDTRDAQNMAVLLRGGRLPQASGSPAARRATRALRRRRWPLRRHRAARLAHLQTPHRQSPLPAMGKQRAYHAHRDGGAARWPAPAGPKRVDGALARRDCEDQ